MSSRISQTISAGADANFSRRSQCKIERDPQAGDYQAATISFTAPATIQVTRRNDSEGKPEEHLYFESGPAPEELAKKFADTPRDEKQAKPAEVTGT